MTNAFPLQVRTLLDQVADKLASFSEVGISPAHVDHIHCELVTYEAKVCVSNDGRHFCRTNQLKMIQKVLKHQKG